MSLAATAPLYNYKSMKHDEFGCHSTLVQLQVNEACNQHALQQCIPWPDSWKTWEDTCIFQCVVELWEWLNIVYLIMELR
jgi:hypothetical protein